MAGIWRWLPPVQKQIRTVVGQLMRYAQALAGAVPAATGAVVRKLQALRAGASTQPQPTGTVVRLLHALRAVAGVMPAASGTLTYRLSSRNALFFAGN